MAKTLAPPAAAKRMVTYVRFSAGVIQKLDRMAAKEESNRSAVIRAIVLRALRETEGDGAKHAA